MAVSVVEKLLVNIEANAAQLQAELAKGGQSVQAFGKQTDAIAKGADGIGQRYSSAAVQIASAAENMARAGKVGGDGLKQIIVQGSNMAFLFGAKGAVVGAVGIASLAILEIFRKTRDEVAKTTAETKQAIAELQNAGDVASLTDRARVLFSGTPAKGFKDGLKSLREELAALGQEVENSPLAEIAADGTLNDPLRTLSEKTRERYKEVRETLSKVEAEFSAVRAAIQGAGPQAARAVIPITTTVTSPEAASKNAAASARALRDLQQGYADLIAQSKAGEVTLEAFDRRVRELADAFADKLQKPTKAQAAAFQSLQKSATVARDALATLTVENATRQFERLRNALLPEALRSYSLALADLRRQLEKEKLSTSQIDEIVAITEAVSRGQRESDALKSRIGLVLESSIAPMAKLNQLTGERIDLEARLIGLTGKRGPEVDQERLDIQQRLLAIEEAMAVVGERNQNIAAATTKRGDELAAAFDAAASSAFGISTALLGSESAITRTIGSVAQLAQGFAKIAALAAAQEGGLGALFSTGAGLASALPGIGAIVGGLGALASTLRKEDPATKALREALDRNAERLREFTSSVGELVQVSISGGAAAAIRDQKTQQTFEVEPDPRTGEQRFETRDFNSKQLLAQLRGAGVALADLQKIAADFGVTFANLNAPTVAELRQLQAFIRENALKKLTDSLAGQLKLLELRARIDPDAFAGIAGVVERIKVLTAADTGIPAIAAALGDIKLSDADGPARAIERLKKLLADFTAGDIDLAALGDLNPDQFAETIAALIESIRNATPALQSPADRFAAAIEAFGTAVELGSLTAEQKLAKAKDLFATLFPDLAAGVDTSSAEGFKDSIKGIIDGFAADGDLSEAEQAQIAVLRALLGAFEGATPAAEQLADALSVLSDRFEIFGTGAADQITAILEEVTGDSSIGKNAGFALLKGLTDGLDLATDAGQADLRARAKAIFEQLSEGGITAEEQAVIDTIKRLLGLAGDVADEAARAAADAIADQERQDADRRRKRQGLLDGAETDIKLNDVTDPIEQLRIRVAALAKAFPAFGDVLADFDVATQDGRDAMEAWIRSIAGSPEDLERLAAAMGITVDELLSALVGLEAGADDAAEKVATLADQLGAAFDATDFANELEGVTDPLEKLKRTSAAVGDVLPAVGDIFKQFSLDTAEGRAGAEAALIALGKSTSDAAVRSAVLKLLAQIRGVPTPESTLAGGSGVGRGADEGRANVQAASSITEVTGNRLVDLFQRNVAATEAVRDALVGSLARTLSVPAPLTPPALPSLLAAGVGGGSGSGSSGIAISVTLQNVFAGPVTTTDSDELSRTIHARTLQLIQSDLATELLVALRRAGVARSN